jgi:hypothetical protein
MTPNPLPAPPGQPKSSNLPVIIIISVVVLFGCCGVGGICKANLKQIYIAEKSYQVEKGVYSEELAELDFHADRTRYAYLLGRNFVKPTHPEAVKDGLLEQTPAAIRQALGVTEKAFSAACIGNIDNDQTLDVWTISSEARVIDGQTVPAGVPFNEQNDLNN